MVALEPVTTRTARIWLDDDGILRLVSLPYPEHDLEHAQENTKAIAGLLGDRKAAFLLDVRGSAPPSHAARNHYAGVEGTKRFYAMAIMIGSPVSKVIGNAAMAFSKQTLTTKLFTSEADAISWLKGFLS